MEIKQGIDGFCITPSRGIEKIIYAYNYKFLWNREYTTRNITKDYLNSVLNHLKR